MTTTAMLGAFAAVLMFLEFPLVFIAPSFYKLDLSEVPALIGTFAFGPIQGIIIEIIKILIHFVIKGTSTAFVGEFSNYIIGCAMIIPADIFYHMKRTKKNAILGMIVATLIMGVAGVFLNAYLLIPTYANVLNYPVEAIVGLGHAIFPAVDNVITLCLFCVLPFNLIKGALVTVVVTLIYKPLSRLIRSTPENDTVPKGYLIQCILSFFIPIAGYILGPINLKKEDSESRYTGKMCLVLSITSTVLYAGIIAAVILNLK